MGRRRRRVCRQGKLQGTGSGTGRRLYACVAHRSGKQQITHTNAFDLRQVCAGQPQHAVACMHFHCAHMRRLHEGAGGELIRLGLAVLLNFQMQIAGLRGMLERHGERKVCRSGAGAFSLEVHRQWRGRAVWLHGNGVHAGRARRCQQQLGRTPSDQVPQLRSRCLRLADDVPTQPGKLLEWDIWPSERVEAPLSTDAPGQHDRFRHHRCTRRSRLRRRMQVRVLEGFYIG